MTRTTYVRTLLILILLIASCGNRGDSDKERAHRAEIKGAKTETVHKKEVEEYYRTSGTVKAKTISDVASRVMGAVTSISVKEGDRVKQGDVLLTIDDRDYVQKVRAAREAQVEARNNLDAADKNKRLAELTYDRYKNLYNDKALSAHEMDEIETRKDVAASEAGRARAALEGAEANMKESEIELGFTRVKAPVTGIVTGKEVEVGSMAVPGRKLMRVEDNSSFRLDVSVDENLSGKLEPGMNVYADVEALGKRIEGTIAEVVPAIDPATRSFLIKISLGDDGLKTGLYSSVLIPTGKREALLIPPSAVVRKGQLEGVYTVSEEGIATYRLVRTGNEYDGRLEVLSGLRDGDVVIIEGAERASDGGLVEGG